MSPSGGYILAVDDEEGFRLLYTRMLEPAGYRVRTAVDAMDALRITREEPPDVAILDIHLAGQDGLWLADQIRAQGTGTAMILATSDAAVPPIASLKPGIVAYLVKPYDTKTVRDAVEQALAWRQGSGAQTVPVAAPAHGVPDYSAPEPVAYSATQSFGRDGGWSTERKLLWGLVLLLAAALVGAIIWYFTVGQQGNLLARVSAASGLVRTLGPNGKVVMQGSGFFVVPDVFVTAHHVVKDGVGVRIEGAGQTTYRAEGIVGINREQDLVLLRTSPAAPAQLAISESPPEVGEKIAVYGAPLGLAGTLSTGIVSAQSGSSRLQISAPISPGSSGSPVLNARGAVVGVAVESRMAGQALNFAVPAFFVQRLLAGAATVRPFFAVARGAGDDRERHELIGPVRLVTITADVQITGVVDDVVAGGTAPVGTIRLSFDQLGRLVEREDAVAGATSYFTHDEQGRLKSETLRRADATVTTWDFTNFTGGRLRAVDLKTGIVRLVGYTNEGRLLSEITRHGTNVLSERHWTYETPAWPGVPAEMVASGAVQLDPLGNVTVHRLPSGVELRFRYGFDDRGNWVLRETVRHAGGQSQPVRSDRRAIEYWE